MHTYKFTIKEYQAIRNASVDIKGITVLSGINGCGKSTFSRWLYYIVNKTSSFEEAVLEEFRSWCHNYFRGLVSIEDDALTFVERSEPDLFQAVVRPTSMKDITFLLDSLDAEHIGEGRFSAVVDHVAFNLSLMQRFEGAMQRRKERIMKAVSAQVNAPVNSLNSDDLFEVIATPLSNQIKRVHNELNQQSMGSLKRLIKEQMGESDEMPKQIQLYEDGVELLESKRFTLPLGLNSAIYIDTPMCVGRNMLNVSYMFGRDTDHWNEINRMLLQPKKEMSAKAKKLMLRLKRILGGEVTTTKNDNRFAPELRFHAKDGLDIPIVKAATGFKTFSYLLRLLENGYLDEQTVLIIDEPEAHLHPAWAFEFARCLVLLRKEVGTFVVVASHNPDMVQSLRTLAEYEGILDDASFFLAQPSEEQQGRYDFIPQDKEIGNIFNSFNEALRNNQDYERRIGEMGV